MVYFAVVLIPVVLLGYDGPWLGGGNIDIRGRAPFPSRSSRPVRSAISTNGLPIASGYVIR